MVRLEPISLVHAEAVQTLASDPLIAATSNVPHPYPPDGALTWILWREALVGVCGVLNISGAPRRGELGYWIGVPYWNRGYASSAARYLVQRVFTEHGIEELYSSCLVRNRASFRVLEKTGFRHVGYDTQADSKWGPDDRFAIFEMTKQEWAQGLGLKPQGLDGLSPLGRKP